MLTIVQQDLEVTTLLHTYESRSKLHLDNEGLK